MSNNKGFKFCPFCGSQLKMAYPGAGRDKDGVFHEGDPEYGPATPRCLKNIEHGDPHDHLLDFLEESASEVIDDFLEEKVAGYRDGPWDPEVPAYARWAAQVLQAHRHEERVLADRDWYANQRKTWYEAAWYGADCDDYPPTRMQTYLHLTRRWPSKKS